MSSVLIPNGLRTIGWWQRYHKRLTFPHHYGLALTSTSTTTTLTTIIIANMQLPTSLLSALLLTAVTAAPAARQQCSPSSSNSSYWTDLATLSTSLQEHAAVAIDTKIYIVGGLIPEGDPVDNVATVASVQVYDIPTDTWAPLADLPVTMNHPNLATVNGKLYILGGLSANVNGSFWGIGDSFEYDPATDAWATLPSLPEGTYRGSSVVVVYGDLIIVAGGVEQIEQILDGEQATVDTVSAFDITTKEWLSFPSLPEGREHTGGAIIDDVFYLVGGRIHGELNKRDTVFKLDLTDLDTLEWTTAAGRMPTPRGGMSVAAIGDRIFAFGGEGNQDPSAGNTYNNTEVYNVKTDCWEEFAPMPIPRHGFAAVSVGDIIYTPGGGTRNYGSTDQFQALHVGGL